VRAVTSEHRAGWTLVETTLGLALFALVGASFLGASQRGWSAYRRSAANASVDAQVTRTLARITRELVYAGAQRLDPPQPVAPLGAASLEFQVPVDFAGPVTVWGALTRMAFEREPGELDNGVDDDGDWLVDEGQVVLTRDVGSLDERRVVLARGVRERLAGEDANAVDDNGNGLVDEPGLCFERRGETLVVRLSLVRVGPDRELMVRTLESTITLRN